MLTLLLFCAYTLNFRFGDSADTVPTTMLPDSILSEGTFNLDRARPMLSANGNILEICLTYFNSIQERDGHLVSAYPAGAAIMALPVYAVAKYTGHLKHFHQYRIAGKISASLMVALSAAFIFFALSLSIEAKAAWMIALFFGLGTSAWSVSSQALWQHGPGTLCLAVATYALCRMERTPSRCAAFFAGLFLGLAIWCRMLNAFPAAALTLFVLLHRRKYFLVCIAPLAAIFALIMYYNFATFGDANGGYAALFHAKVHAWRGAKPSQLFTHPVGQGFADIFISPSRGLLIYSPFVIPGLIASFYLAVHPRSDLHRYLALWFVLTSILLAKNIQWWGGSTYGPRYFSETCVALAMLTGAAWPWIRQHRVALTAFVFSGALSIFIHGIGAFFAPCGWELTPVPNDHMPSRHWDWRDPEIMRCGEYGMKNGFKPPEILMLLSDRSRG